MNISIAIVVLLSVAVLLLLVCYYLYLYRHFGYVLSPFNFTLLTTGFTFVLTPYFWSADSSWLALGIGGAASMRPCLLESIAINLSGFFVFLVTLLFLTQREASGRTRKTPFIDKTMSAIDQRVVVPVLLCSILFFCFFCLAYNEGTFPLLNGNRSFYYQTSISPLYLACLEVIKVLGLYAGLCAARQGGWMPFIMACGALLMSGNRSPVLVGLLLPIAVYCLILPTKRKRLSKIAQSGLFKIALALTIVGVVGLGLQGIRSGQGLLNFNEVIGEVLDGNTFSDIRDGAFVLNRFNDTFDGKPIGGMTYAAGAISFIPSSLSDFRELWSWGRFTSETLAGFTWTHFGLRGGPFMESYINFGTIGVIVFGLAQGFVFHKLDYLMRIYLFERPKPSNSILALPFFATLYNVTVCSSDTYNIYVYLVLITLLQFVSLPHVMHSVRLSAGQHAPL